MSYRDDSAARNERATQLIDEIAQLEKQKLAATAADAKIEDAKRELAGLSVALPPAPPEARPGLVAHLLVFGATAAATCLGYTLL
jgi:hypothetical protein